ncbi:hypothetical protein PENTCL1PPCAC_792, partial [Pristionchus entomophagus]
KIDDDARVDELTQKLAQYEQSSVADRAKIDELTLQLAKYEGALQELQLLLKPMLPSEVQHSPPPLTSPTPPQ